MPYKDVYQLGVEIRGRAIEHAKRFEVLSGGCEHKSKPPQFTDPRYARMKLMAHCSISGNNVKKKCCIENCMALLE